jgi:hypothetical protein
MAATAERQRLTEVLLDTIEAAPYPRQADLDRVERLISSRDELERYVAMLTEKVECTMAPYGPTLDRLERLLDILQRLDAESQ